MQAYTVVFRGTMYLEDPGSTDRPPGIWPTPPVYPSHPWFPPTGGPPPGIWPTPPVYPSHPIVLPPGIWGGPWLPPYVSGGPIIPPGQPPVFQPAPPEYSPPSSPPVNLPDFASPGYWCRVLFPNKTEHPGWVQTAINTSEDHVPKEPQEGLPGEWLAVFQADVMASVYAWVPSAIS